MMTDRERRRHDAEEPSGRQLSAQEAAALAIGATGVAVSTRYLPRTSTSSQKRIVFTHLWY